MMDDEEMVKPLLNAKEDLDVSWIVFANGYYSDKKYNYYYQM